MKNYTQAELDALISCPKRIIEPPRKEMKVERGTLRNDMKLVSLNEKTEFIVFMRINEHFQENFSIGLTVIPKDEPGSFCVLRCNGPHGEHTNAGYGEENPHFDFHIHRANASMLAEGMLPEKFAEKTETYASYEEALSHFVKLTNIQNVGQYITLQDQLSFGFPQGEQI